MTETLTMTERPSLYRRKSDGRIVRAADWSDGDVSWLLHSIPLISFHRVVGTISRHEFDAQFEAVNGSRVNNPITLDL